jgi:GNAT superfamily N-acetyltransferase
MPALEGPGDIRFVRASPDDLPTVLSILTEAAEWAKARGVEGLWRVPFPPEWVLPSLTRGEVYLIYQETEAVATFTFRWIDPSFWGETAPDAGYLHRLAVRRSAAGQGLGRQIIEWALARVRAEGRDFLRLDCHSSHAGLRRYYISLGFRPVRSTVVGDGFEVVLLERPVP